MCAYVWYMYTHVCGCMCILLYVKAIGWIVGIFLGVEQLGVGVIEKQTDYSAARGRVAVRQSSGDERACHLFVCTKKEGRKVSLGTQ